MDIIDNATVFKFVLHFDSDCRPEDRQERYVVATSEAEAMDKFNLYLLRQEKAGFMKPYCYSFYPTVEIDYCIM
jgi:hypothetical protein